MTRIITRLILLAIVVILPAPCSFTLAQQNPPPEEKEQETKTGSISGTVVTDSGQPLAGASVFIAGVGGPGQYRTTSTDSDGNFQAKGLDTALYTVNVRLPAYLNPPRDPDDPQPVSYYRIGDTVKVVQIKGGVITGTVTNLAGEPVVSVSVRATMIRDAFGQTPKMAFAISPFERPTDDRGIYRIYGLPPGSYLISAGGGNRFNTFNPNAYDTDVSTYSPSSTRDTAAEITLRAGDEMTGVDIRYRGEPGRTVSGTASSGLSAPGTTGVNYAAVFVTLVTVVNGGSQLVSTAFQSPGSRGFAFTGIGDGDYDLIAQSQTGTADVGTSEPRHIKVRGADVTGIELITRPLPTVSGKIYLELAKAPECKGKRRPSFSETLFTAFANDKDPNTSLIPRLSGAQAVPDKEGSFTLRNVYPGQYQFDAQFFARYWYLQRISSPPGAAPPGKSGTTNQPTDLAKRWTPLKLGDQLKDVKVTLAEGAASLRGRLTIPEGQEPQPKAMVYLVPVERESAEDVLRFFAAQVAADGSFAANNLAPGRYWVLGQLRQESAPASTARLRRPEQNALRTRLRREAEVAKLELELKPCQNVTDYKLPFKF